MTTFRAPFNVRQGDLTSEVTAISIDTSGSAIFAGDVGIAGTVSAATGNIGGHTFAASAITFLTSTTAPSSDALPSAVPQYLKLTVNGSAYKIPLIAD